MTLDVLRLLQLAEDVLRKDLAELDTHLVCIPISALASSPHTNQDTHTKGVDAPNNTLREDLVLVQRDESPKRRRRQEREDDTVARAVALEDLGLHKRIRRVRPELLAHLFLSLTERERLGLREEVREQDSVVLRVRDRVVRRRRREEVGRDELRALVHELVE